MLLKAFVIRDNVANFYHYPIFLSDAKQLDRDMHTLVNDPDCFLCQRHNEYSIYSAGEFDTDLGVMLPADLVKLHDLSYYYVKGDSKNENE